MRLVPTIILSLLYHVSLAQHTVRIELSVPANPNDSVFIAGDFNGWNPRSIPLQKSADRKFFLEKTNVPAGIMAFKFTKGSWSKVEIKLNGADVDNRELLIQSDTIFSLEVEAWREDASAPVKKMTASKQVSLMDSAFAMRALDRKRKIWVYLPPGYKESKKNYPVIYMHDGQNLFDESQAEFGEWGIDEILDSLTLAGKPSAIIIGIENGPKRLNEYNPYFFERAGQGEGDAYLDFIIKDLKPAVDKKYRTLKFKENTTIAGSSMGGLISYYAALKYDNVFGRAGVFSPAFWTAPAILPLTDSLASKAKGMYFFYKGELEGKEMIKKMDDVITSLGKSSNALIYNITDPTGKHNESAWRKWFTEFYLWITGNGLNHIIK